MNDELLVGSEFSGGGGTALGFEWAGCKHVWFVEKEPYAQAVLRKNFPGAIIYGDITETDFSAVPKIDILELGFPCQDISNAGARAGIEGSRSSLWKYGFESIRILRPRVVSIENVSALIDRGLDVVLADLASIGYDAEWHCFPASAVGAPHRRDRIFILAYPNGQRQLHGQSRIVPDCGGGTTQHDARESSQALANSDDAGMRELEALRTPKSVVNTDNRQLTENEVRAGRHASRCGCDDVSDTRCRGNDGEQREKSGEGEGTDGRGWWSFEPDVGRVADGVPSRVDRIKCLGNAVVPQVAQAVAETIKEVIASGKLSE